MFWKIQIVQIVQNFPIVQILQIVQIIPIQIVQIFPIVQIIPIPIQIGDLENTHLFRTPIVIPIECWYYGSVNSIFINCLTPINNLKVRVQNMETGEMSVEEYESVSSSLLIPFANIPGCYNIELVVNKSQSFIGSFEVE